LAPNLTKQELLTMRYILIVLALLISGTVNAACKVEQIPNVVTHTCDDDSSSVGKFEGNKVTLTLGDGYTVTGELAADGLSGEFVTSDGRRFHLELDAEGQITHWDWL
jgi:hypothetical protein